MFWLTIKSPAGVTIMIERFRDYELKIKVLGNMMMCYNYCNKSRIIVCNRVVCYTELCYRCVTVNEMCYTNDRML